MRNNKIINRNNIVNGSLKENKLLKILKRIYLLNNNSSTHTTFLYELI